MAAPINVAAQWYEDMILSPDAETMFLMILDEGRGGPVFWTGRYGSCLPWRKEVDPSDRTVFGFE